MADTLPPGERRILKLEIVEEPGPYAGHFRFNFLMTYDDADFYKLCCALHRLASDMFGSQIDGWISRPDKPINQLYNPTPDEPTDGH